MPNEVKLTISFFIFLADEEFDELCFEFGLELDEIVCIGYCLFFKDCVHKLIFQGCAIFNLCY